MGVGDEKLDEALGGFFGEENGLLVGQADFERSGQDGLAPVFSVVREVDGVGLDLPVAVSPRPSGIIESLDLLGLRVFDYDVVRRLGQGRLEAGVPEGPVGTVQHLLLLHSFLETAYRDFCPDGLEVRLQGGNLSGFPGRCLDGQVPKYLCV